MNNLWNSFYPQLFALLVNTAWQLALLVMLIFLSIFLLKIRTAAMRYGLWLMVVFSPLFLPLLNLAVPAVNIVLFQHQSDKVVYEERGLLKKYSMAIPENAYRLPRKSTELSDEKPDAIKKSSSISKEQPGVTTYSRFFLPISFKEMLLLLWMLGTFGMAARFAKGYMVCVL
jgi:beta-lactamase regulating signal transducer with metallopeptidase domain